MVESAKLSHLSAKKRELIEHLLAEKRRAREEAAQRLEDRPADVIPRRSETSPVPLSFAQQRLWFIDQLDPGTPIFNIPAAIRMRGSLVVKVFEEGIQGVIRRHETLRTSFVTMDGQGMQVIAEEASLETPVIDLQGLVAEADQLALVRQFATQDCQRSFALDKGPLLRTTLVRLGPEDHVLIMMLQHIIGDVWSVRLFMKELATLYQAILSGRESPLPELQVQYADYAIWQREWLTGEVLEEHLSYWRGQLEGMPEELNLPLDRPRPPVQTIWGAKEFLAVPRSLCEAVKALGRDEGASPFMTFVAAWKALLHQMSGQDDIVVGVPAANRSRSEVEGLIGFFVNSLVLRTKLDGNPTFRELLLRQREVTLGAFSHQEFPFERLVGLVQPERTMSRNALFQTDVVLQNAPMEAFQVPSMTFEPLPTEDGTAQLDITLDLWEEGDAIGGWLEYDTDLFDHSTMQRMVKNYVSLLEVVTADPERRLADLPRVGNVHRQQILLEWNDQPAAGAGELAHRRFSTWAKRQPDAPSVVWGGETWSYRQLSEAADGIAFRLLRHGMTADQPVAVCLGTSFERIAAVLGVLKAGGAYVPLDPDYGSDRLAYILEDCGAGILLTTGSLMESMAELGASSAEKILLEEIEETPVAAIDVPVAPENLAYIVYTSGSTGQPKGVMVSHGAFDASYRGWERSYRLLTSARRHLQMASFSFDVFSGDLVRALCSGGALVLCPRDFLLDPPELARLLREQEVDAAEFVPAVVRGLVGHLKETGGSLAQMRLMVVGSDVWTNAEMATVAALGGPDTRVISSYGVSEATIDSSFFEDQGFPLPAERAVPIGRPFAGSQLYVLGKDLQPTPLGVPGELVIGGENLARGYHGKAAMTAVRFSPNPFHEGAHGSRLYHTGDLARFLSNGQIEFLGRTDFQVKIRGYRVEPGEVESALEEAPGIQEAVVVARKSGEGEAILAAFVVPRGGEPLDELELRHFLGERLPQYMVPTAIVVLEEMPLTPNGKVDRKALPALDGERLASASYVEPRNLEELALVKIWGEILEVAKIGAEDNLFELGAHSLLLTRVISRIRKEFGVAPGLRSFFEDPTVAGMARAIAAQRKDRDPDVPPIVAIPREGHLRLSFTQERMWFLDQLQPGLTAYNVPGAVWMEGALDRGALERGLSEIIRRHEIFRTTYTAVEGQPIQVVEPHRPFELPLVDLTGLPEEVRSSLAMDLAKAGARIPFDLTESPLLRAALLRCGPRAHRLAMTTHHIAYDMWARDIFINELGLLYVSYSAGRPSPLPEPELQFVDFAAWQRNWLQGEVLETQLDYWRKKLDGVPNFLELPTDKPRPPVQSFLGQRQYVLLRADLAAAVHTLSRSLDVTPFIAVLAAFKAVLQRWAGTPDVVVGSPIANRGQVELEGVMGFLANTVVLHTSLAGDPTFLDLLKRVRDTSLGASTHQDVPFEMLVQELAPERDMSRSPLFQVMFNFMLHYKPPRVALPDLELEVETLHGGGAQFDINIDMFQTEQGLHGVVEHATDVYCDTTVARMMKHLETLLGAAVENPSRRLSELPLMPAAQRQQILLEWNDTDNTRDLAALFPGLFLDQAAQRPEAIAVACDGQTLTYEELARRAKGIAHYLSEHGVGEDSVVPLLAPRGLDFLCGILGIFLANGAYMPLDPDHPPGRHRELLALSGARLVLASRRLTPALEEALGSADPAAPKVVELEALGSTSSQADLSPRTPSSLAPSSLAYVLFTSGSTGTPKGVMIHHAGMLNHLWANVDALAMSSEDVLAQTANQCFDISVWQFLAPLMLGGRVEIFPDEVTHDPPRLLREVDDRGVTVFETVPSLLQLMLSEIQLEQAPALQRLRWLIPTGEALSVPLQRQWSERYPWVPLVNAYGPSECSDDTTLEILRDALPEEATTVAIGRPVANLSMGVVDARLRIQSVGASGELVVGGVGVGRGYLSDPRRTAEVFVPDSNSRSAGARLYRSGDLGRWLPQGSLEFLGRLDSQIKLRGFRIELGEVEAALARHPAVRDAAVVLHEAVGAAGDRHSHLVAYFVPRPGSTTTPEDLKVALGEALPAYMVPSALMPLEALPLNANGKVDRKALPEPNLDAWRETRVYVAPRDAQEEALVEIFQEVLGLDEVSVEDDFFDLGGHSLLAIQVLARIRERFGVEPPLKTLFESSTAAGMAEVLCAIEWASRSLEMAASEVDEESLMEEGVL